MDTILLIVTTLSLVLAFVLATVVVRLLRDERRRSDARVAALLAMSSEREGYVDSIDIAPWNVDPTSSPAPQTRAEDFSSTQVRADMFGATSAGEPSTTSSPWAARLAVIVPMALIIVSAAIAFYPSRGEIGSEGASATSQAATDSPRPLELLSLRHGQRADTLTVTGLVQNPRNAGPVSKVFATAFVFGADGTFLASGRAPLDFTTLGPGDESPFVVTVPVKGDVARYRVGFRGEDGRVIAHVDRRGGAVARAVEEQP